MAWYDAKVSQICADVRTMPTGMHANRSDGQRQRILITPTMETTPGVLIGGGRYL